MPEAVDARALASTYRETWPATSFLAQLDPSTVEAFLSTGDVVRYRKGEQLIEEEAACDEVFLLLSACTKVTVRLGSDGRALLAVRVGGDILGEVAAMDRSTRMASVHACGHEPAVAVRLTKADFDSLLMRHPEAAIVLSASLSRKLRAATRRRVDYTTCSTRVRLARVLVELAEDYGQAAPARGLLIGVNLTQADLGTLVGAKEDTAQHELRKLRSEKLIASGRRPLIRDLAALRAVAYPDHRPKPVV